MLRITVLQTLWCYRTALLVALAFGPATGFAAAAEGPSAAVVSNHATKAEPADLAGVPGLLQSAQDKLALGAYDLALRELQEAEARLGQGADERWRVTILSTLGDAYLGAGMREEARRALDRSLELARQAKLIGAEAAALNSRGNLMLAGGDKASALRSYEESARLADRADRPDVVANATLNGARVLIEEDRTEAASEWLQRTEGAIARQPPSSDKAMQLLTLGHELMGLDARERAFRALREAETLANAAADLRLQSYSAGYLGRLYQAQQRPDDALELTRRALFLAQAVGAPEVLYLWQWQLGRLLSSRGQMDEAIHLYQQAVGTLRDLRPELIAIAARGGRSARSTVEPFYLEFADLLLRRAEKRLDQVASQEDLDQARSMIEQFRAVELEDYFRDDCVAELQRRVRTIDRLAPGTAAIYPILLPERTVLLLSLPDGLVQEDIPIGAEQLSGEVHTLRQLLEKRSTHQYLPHAQALYDRLIRPLEPHLDSAAVDTLVFVPDGALRTIPLAALHNGEGFLIDRFAVATVPGLELLDPRPLAEARLSPLLNGLTEAVQGFPSLPFVAGELQAIADMYGGEVLKDRGFVVPELEQSLAKTPFTVVHIASHGEFSGNAEDSFLLTYDGRLDMDKLEQFIKLSRFRDEPIELLTLSACRTAAGDDRAALGLAGVAIKAGARSALATLWFINDDASARLVTEFYRQLGQNPRPTKAEALRAAQRSIKADPRYGSHPAYWAPFLIIGNWL